MKKFAALLLALAMMMTSVAALADTLVMATNASFLPYEYYDGETIVGNGCIDGNGNPRFRHRRNLAISVRKAYWGNGIGSGLMERLIAFARGTGAEVISLEVRSDNDRAKALYRKFGFTSFGVFRKFFKLGEAYFDADYMNLYL